MDSPTIDQALTKRLGLNLDVKRTNIEGMGCLTGYRLLNLAGESTFARPKARILVVEAELRSLIGNSLPAEPTRSDIISAALFRDAASACVVGSTPRRYEQVAYNILGGMSRIVENSTHLVNYYEEDGGSIRLHLSRDLPDAIEKVEMDFVTRLMDEATENYNKIKLPPLEQFDIACHTGGPRILENVGRGLGLDGKDHLAASWQIMKSNGNLSGASNMAVLDAQNKLGGRDWVVCLSMGPGIALEGLLLCRPSRHDVMLSHQGSRQVSDVSTESSDPLDVSMGSLDVPDMELTSRSPRAA
jgi:predicted naringenin-chalcone synthase